MIGIKVIVNVRAHKPVDPELAACLSNVFSLGEADEVIVSVSSVHVVD